MSTIIEAKGLTKKYGDQLAVEDLNLQIEKGECFGLLGPNGAGKSTSMKMMYCSSRVTEGELYVLGLNVKKNYREIKHRIGVVPQDDGLDAEFSVRENLLVYASYFGFGTQHAIRRADELLRLLRLEEERDKPIYALSGGMRRRLAIARGLINEPDLLFLDEPTAGLDPQARAWIWDFLKELKSQNRTTVLTTHYMEEAEQLCDRIAIIDKGKILCLGLPKELIAAHIGIEVVDFDCSQADLHYYISRLKENGYQYNVIHSNVSVYLKPGQEGKKILSLVSTKRITIRRPTLNDVFLKIAGHDLREDIFT